MMSRSLSPAVLLMCCVSVLGLAESGGHSFTASLDTTPTTWKPTLTECFGSGHAALTLREDWRAQLRQVKKDIDPTFVRFHGLFDDDMSVMLNKNQPLSMYNIFSTFDFLLSIDMKPIVEMSFMPSLLANDSSLTVFHYKGITSPPASFDDWYNFIHSFGAELLARYGEHEISQWWFECWNEPNLGFWRGTQQQYFQLYNATSRALKDVSPKFRVGGPATAQLAWLPDFLGNTSAMGAAVDVVTSHLYPSDPQLNHTRTSFLDAVSDAASVVDKAGLPFVMTEFNSGLNNPDKQASAYSSSFLVHVAQGVQAIDALKVLSWWTFSDVFEEGGLHSVPFPGTYSIQTITGVPHPTYRAFQLLKQLQPGIVLRQTSDNIDITVSVDAAKQAVTAIISNWNYQNLPIANETVSVTVSGWSAACGAPTSVMVTHVDESHGQAQGAWEAMGSPTYPTPTQHAALVKASEVQPVKMNTSVSGAGTASFSVDLPAYGVVFASMSCA